MKAELSDLIKDCIQNHCGIRISILNEDRINLDQSDEYFLERVQSLVQFWLQNYSMDHLACIEMKEENGKEKITIRYEMR